MTYGAILDNFSLRWLSRSLEEEVIRLVFRAKCLRVKPQEELQYIVKHLSDRWASAFDSPEVNEEYKIKTYITMAVLLHKYDYQDKTITKRAIEGLNDLKADKYDLMPSHMYKKVDETIKLLSTLPEYKKAKPTPKSNITQFRAGDVFSIRINKKFYAGLVTQIHYVNEYPEVVIYKKAFDKKPKLAEIENIDIFEKRFGVMNLNYLPDMAGQIELIGSKEIKKMESTGYILADIFKLIEDIQQMFKK